MSNDDFSLTVPATPVNLAMIRSFVQEFGAQAGLPSKQLNKLELAVDEACSNMIEHGAPDSSSNHLTLKGTFDDNTVRIAILDNGTPFDPTEVEVKSLEVKKCPRKRGRGISLGIPILRSLMDDIEYHSLPDNGNELELVLRKV